MELDRLIEWAWKQADTNPYFRNVIAMGKYEHLVPAALQMGYDPMNPPLFPLTHALPVQGIPIGNVLEGDRVCGSLNIPTQAFSVSTLVCGTSGCGKSTLVKCCIIPHLIGNDIKVIVFDSEDQYHSFLCQLYPPDKAKAFKPAQFKMNPVQIPAGMTRDEWINIFTERWRVLYAGEGMINMLREIMVEGYRSYSVPTLHHLKAILERKRYKTTERHYNHWESLRRCFNMILGTFGKTFDCAEGFLKKDVLDLTCIIFRMKGLDTLMGNWFQDVFVERLKCAQNPLSSSLKIVIVFEEAHLRFWDGTQKRGIEIGERLALTHARTLRKYGIGTIYVDQVPSLLPIQVLANLGTIISFRLINSKDTRAIGDVMGLSPDQRDELTSFPNRRAIVFSHLC